MSCDKPLPCGQHKCFKLCHLGPCDTCLQVRDKPCRCGKTHKVSTRNNFAGDGVLALHSATTKITLQVVTCGQELTCEIKCNSVKRCGRHSCKKKCCPATECGDCDKRCDKTLPCRNHKVSASFLLLFKTVNTCWLTR